MLRRRLACPEGSSSPVPVVVAAGKSFKQTDIELEKMNYLVEGVLGSF